MKKRSKLRPIYSPDYYRLEKAIRGADFKKNVATLRKEYADLGCPLPLRGFKKYDQYLAWLDRFWKAYVCIEQGEELRDEIERIKDKGDPLTLEQMHEIQAVQDRALPTVPGEFIAEALANAGLDPDNKKYGDFLESNIFFGKKHLDETLFYVRWIRNDQDTFDLMIQLLPHTRLEHIEAHWRDIDMEQRSLPGYIGKNKERASFDRDLEIAEAYLAVRKKLSRSRANRKLGEQPLDIEAWNALRAKDPKRFKHLTLSRVRSAVSRVASIAPQPKEAA